MNNRIAFVLFAATLSSVAFWGLRPAVDRTVAEEPKILATIDELLEQRRDTLAEAFQASLNEFQTGHANPDRAMRLNDQLLTAEIELANDDGSRMRAYVAHLREARKFEKFAILKLNNGTGTRQDMLDAKAQRLLAEINIARLQK